MLISNRHIRHDWKTFVDWPQISVRTVCKITTRQGLAGIPGITDQPQILPGGRWGWCMRCVLGSTEDFITLYSLPEVDKAIYTLYNNAEKELAMQLASVLYK